MTAINPIGATNPTNPTQPLDATFQSRMQQALAPVASLFGETPDQLMSELNSGNTSLSALAAQKGVSQTDLVNAIKQGLQSTAPANGQAPSDTQLTNIANRIANHRHGGHHHHGAGGVGATQTTPEVPATGSTATTSATSAATDQLLQLLESSGQG